MLPAQLPCCPKTGGQSPQKKVTFDNISVYVKVCFCFFFLKKNNNSHTLQLDITKENSSEINTTAWDTRQTGLTRSSSEKPATFLSEVLEKELPVNSTRRPWN